MSEVSEHKEPLAIVGMGCRFPGGAASPDKLWDLLITGVDAICDVPKDRWDIRRFYNSNTELPGKMHAREGGFLQENLELFDPVFFGISPREAQSLDPQQRILLEVAWEALEDAGVLYENVSGSNTGVFIGGFNLDNKLLQMNSLNRELISQHTPTSSTMALLSNRISYTFNLKGPSLSIDTACSSSLVATHYACQSIWSGESSMAIAGGANIMLRPEYPIVMSKGHFLSKDSRCKAFDSSADGYTRGEGVGVVIIKPLSKSIEDGDQILGLIRSTGVNHDGKTPGISVPCAESQQELVRGVLNQAGVKPAQINYIEAHGTGTKVGDPIEANSLNAVFQEGREKDNKALLGSLKTNIGHLEAAAGIAGVIKAALVLKNKKVPPHLHFKNPNPEIDFSNLCLKVAEEVEELKNDKQPAFVAVNSFGYGGTNAHILLEEAPPTNFNQELRPSVEPPYLIPVSARSSSALKELCERYIQFFSSNKTAKEISFVDIAYSLTFRRSKHSHRLTVLAKDRESFIEQLQHFSKDKIASNIRHGVAKTEEECPIAFVFTGMGPQWHGMGTELYEQLSVFREAVEHCDRIFREISGWSILEKVMHGNNSNSVLAAEVAQPANFLLQVGLLAIWESWGVKPDAIIGHSVGEIAAAYAAKALSLEDALLVTYHRSRLQQTLDGGAMLAVGLSCENTNKFLEVFENVEIAAINSPSSVTLTGEKAVIEEISSILDSENVFNRILNVEVAYHSYQMDPIREELLEALGNLQPKETQVPLYSTVSGARVDGIELNAQYWWRNVREPVKFGPTLSAMVKDGYENFLQIGAHPVLNSSIFDVLEENGRNGVVLASLKRNERERYNMLNALGELFALGREILWSSFTPNGRYQKLPLYPWQKSTYWNESERSKEERLGYRGHVYLNQRHRSVKPTFEVEVNELYFPYLNDHLVNRLPVLPGAAYCEIALAVGRETSGQDPCTVENLEFHQMFVFDETKVQTLLSEFDPKTREFSIYSKERGVESERTLHTSGRILSRLIGEFSEKPCLETLKTEFEHSISADKFYSNQDKRGLHYGSSFRLLNEIFLSDDSVLAKIDISQVIKNPENGYLLHPSILDSGFQSLLALTDLHDVTQPFVPIAIRSLNFHKSPEHNLWAYARLTKKTETRFQANILFFDELGDLVAEVEDLTCQALLSEHNHSEQTPSRSFYNYTWNKENFANLEPREQRERWLLFGESNSLTSNLVASLGSCNIDCSLITAGDSFCQLSEARYQVNKNEEDSFVQLFQELSGDFCKMLHLWSQDEQNDPENVTTESVSDNCLPVVYMTKAFAQIAPKQSSELVFLTRGVQIINEEDSGSAIHSSPLSGLSYLIENEIEGISTKIIDLSLKNFDNEINALSAELLRNNKEEDVALRLDGRFVKTLKRRELIQDKKDPNKIILNTDTPLELVVNRTGSIDSLEYKEFKRRAPREKEIELKVSHSSLNFKDLLKVLGRISPKVIDGTYFKNTIGMESVGVVTRIGSDVSQYQVGDELIVADSGGCLKTYITFEPKYIVPKPKSLKSKQSLIIVPYLTVLYGLRHIAKLKEGEKILIHNASGGVGLAAVQYAKQVGAEIFATAGSKKKRDYLKSIGIQHVMHSRNLDFAKEIRLLTDGYGVDVVISSIAGEALQQSFNLLAPYGRFLEIGKKDISENNGLPMSVFNRNITFAAIDVDRLLAEKIELAQEIFREIATGFREGYFYQSPVDCFPAEKVVDAFTYLAESKQIGKVVLDFENREIPVSPVNEAETICLDATYVITGGTSGFGLEIAKWLSEKGVRGLALLSRRGVPDETTGEVISQIEASGTKVFVKPCDVSNYETLKAAFDEIARTMPVVKGIIHAAMVLDDALITQMDKAKFDRVLLPKVAGSLNLHRASKSINLDFFVLLSSVSSIIGNPGQANYVAANSFLEGFARYRSGLGLPGTCINLGPLAEVGVVARNDNLADSLAKYGVSGLFTKKALSALEDVIRAKPVNIGIFDVDWKVWANNFPKSREASRFISVIEDTSEGQGVSEQLLSFFKSLVNCDYQDRTTKTKEVLSVELASILRLPIEKLDAGRAINLLGLDSLMAGEFSRNLLAKYGFQFSMIELLKGSSISQMAESVLKTYDDFIEGQG